ncbi:hypothetical protein [Streptomyces sp. 7N604]|uniref:hypothetical protein n=1 Tax=Streptomyces sp. 7N604 TaxID=3457415 RepID=UPI003FD1216D
MHPTVVPAPHGPYGVAVQRHHARPAQHVRGEELQPGDRHIGPARHELGCGSADGHGRALDPRIRIRLAQRAVAGPVPRTIAGAVAAGALTGAVEA